MHSSYFREKMINSQTIVEKLFLNETLKLVVLFHNETALLNPCNLLMTGKLTILVWIKPIFLKLSPESRAADIQDLGHA